MITVSVFKKYRLQFFSIIYSLILIILILMIYYNQLFDLFENKLLDFRFKYFNQNNTPSKDIVFIDIDEYSLDMLSPQIGGYPWPRGYISQYIIDYVMSGNPSMFLFDILYPNLSPKLPSEAMKEDDSEFIGRCFEYPNLSHAVLFNYESEEKNIKALPEITEINYKIKINKLDTKINFPIYNSYLLPFDPLYQYCQEMHSVTYKEDTDGISRIGTILFKYNNKFYPSLSLNALIHHLKVNEIDLKGFNLILKTPVKKQPIKIPLNKKGYFSINFYKNIGQFKTLTAISIINSAIDRRDGKQNVLVSPDEFKDKIVIIGSSAIGLKDIKNTPISVSLPGPFLHIFTISNILQKHYLHYLPEWATTLIIVFSILFIIYTTMFLKKHYLKNIVGFSYIALQIILSVYLFQYFAVVMEIATTLMACVLSYLGALVFLSLTEEAEKNKVANAMSKYLAPSVMNEVLENYSDLMGEVGDKKNISILFSDIRSFTTISECLPAETVVKILNNFHGAMFEVIFTNRGTLDKIIGDAIMAFWGAPKEEPKQDYLAVLSALQMIESLAEVNIFNREQEYPELRIGIGVHSGDMIVGNIGSERRLDYTVIGDNVNLGARLEGLTKYYKIPVLVSEPIYESTKDQFGYIFVDNVAVKGKNEGIKIYAPLFRENENLQNGKAGIKAEMEIYNKCLENYQNLDFVTAKKLFHKASQELELLRGLCSMFVERCEKLSKLNVPKNWNKVWKMTEK